MYVVPVRTRQRTTHKWITTTIRLRSRFTTTIYSYVRALENAKRTRGSRSVLLASLAGILVYTNKHMHTKTTPSAHGLSYPIRRGTHVVFVREYIMYTHLSAVHFARHMPCNKMYDRL